LALGLLFAACGDDDDSGSPDGSADGDASGYSLQDYPLEAPADAVTTASGLQYVDVVEGDGAAPTLAATTLVTVHYRGRFPDGAEFDSSYGGPPAQFQLGGVIPGFGEGISTMRVGGQRVLYIPGELGYGPGGNPNAGIGPNQPLVFEVELVATQ
jgi:FKBP-type peptidyl-prolyl cis-trans isomerase